MSRPDFPFSHSRSNSTYSLASIPARPAQLKRGNSIRASKDVIPLVLKPEGSGREGGRNGRPVSVFFNRMFTQKEDEERHCSCPSGLDQAKAEARLAAKITNLETVNETKDLTIRMLTEQLMDKEQELEMAFSKIHVLQRALGDPHAMRRQYTDSGISVSSDGYDDLVDENNALKDEVDRLNGVLEESASMVASLGL